MTLTGKAKTDFEEWFDTNYIYDWNYYQEKPTIINAIIIEWFDSVGEIENVDITEILKYYLRVCKINEATEKAIEHANNLYNNK